MKKILWVLLVTLLSSAFALADNPQSSITYVKRERSHHKTQHHHAHRAGKHHAARRNRRMV